MPYHLARVKYEEMNDDVKQEADEKGLDPWVHYQVNGKRENRVWPGALGFDEAVRAYLRRNRDVATHSFWKNHAWLHYFVIGRFENTKNPNRYWSDAIGYEMARDGYLKENNLENVKGIDAWEHYQLNRGNGMLYVLPSDSCND